MRTVRPHRQGCASSAGARQQRCAGSPAARQTSKRHPMLQPTCQGAAKCASSSFSVDVHDAVSSEQEFRVSLTSPMHSGQSPMAGGGGIGTARACGAATAASSTAAAPDRMPRLLGCPPSAANAAAATARRGCCGAAAGMALLLQLRIALWCICVDRCAVQTLCWEIDIMCARTKRPHLWYKYGKGQSGELHLHALGPQISSAGKACCG